MAIGHRGRVGCRRRLRGSRPDGWRRRRILRAERAARRSPGQAAREEHRGQRFAANFRPSTSTRTSGQLPASVSTWACTRADKIAVKGLIAWFMHRGYHGLAIPMWERKIRVFSNWILNFLLRRDMTGIIARSEPRAAFEEFASRPKPRKRSSKCRALARLASRLALIAQPVEADDLKSSKSGFEPQSGHCSRMTRDPFNRAGFGPISHLWNLRVPTSCPHPNSRGHHSEPSTGSQGRRRTGRHTHRGSLQRMHGRAFAG